MDCSCPPPVASATDHQGEPGSSGSSWVDDLDFDLSPGVALAGQAHVLPGVHRLQTDDLPLVLLVHRSRPPEDADQAAPALRPASAERLDRNAVSLKQVENGDGRAGGNRLIPALDPNHVTEPKVPAGRCQPGIDGFASAVTQGRLQGGEENIKEKNGRTEI